MTIGILSDIHGLLRREVLKQLADCDAVLHAGDFDRPDILETLRGIAPLYAVRGNNDGDWARDLPKTLRLTLDGVSFLMIHDKSQLPVDLGDAQVIVFGHSHVYLEQQQNGRLWLNPGSCGKARFLLPVTMMRMNIQNGVPQVQKITLPRSSKEA